MRKAKFFKRGSLLIASLVISGLLAGCGGNQPAENAKEEVANTEEVTQETSAQENTEPSVSEVSFPLTLTDDLGYECTLEVPAATVVSLAPSNTEIIYAIGAGDKLVGRTDYCNYPPEAAEVDSIGTYSAPNMELIMEKTPDLVIAADFIDETIKNQLEEMGSVVYVCSASSVEDIAENIKNIGAMLGASENADKVANELVQARDDLQNAIKEVVKTDADKKSAFFDLGGFYSAGTGSLIDNALNDILVTNIAASSNEPWPMLSAETIVEADPDVYISTYTTADELRGTAGFEGLRCMEDGNLLVLDYETADMIQRAGPRFVEGEAQLAALIYPEIADK